MVQRKQRGRRHSANSTRNKSNLRSVQKQNYKEEKDTQSEKSDDFDNADDEENDDSDFEPLKKYAIKSKKKELSSGNKNFQTVTGSQKSTKISDLALDISKPNLSDSESSDEEVYPTKLEIKPNIKMDELKENKGRFLKAKKEGTIDKNEHVHGTTGMPRKLWFTQPDENEIKMDENIVRGNAPKQPCKDHNASTVDASPSRKMLNEYLVREKAKDPIKDIASSKKGDQSKAEPQTQRKTRNSLKKHKETRNVKEHENSTQYVRSKKSPKKPGKGVAKEKRGKILRQNEEKFSQNLPGPSKVNDEFDDVESDESENEWEDVHEAAIGKSLNESPRKKAKLDSDVKDISINLQVKSIHKSKSGNNKDKFLQFVERRIRKLQNEQQTNLHKCHLVCLVARLKWLNGLYNEEAFKAVCISYVPISFVKVSVAKWDVLHLKRFVNWFRNGVPDNETFVDNCRKILGNFSKITRLQIFIGSLRTMGLLTRLVTSLQPITWKVENSELFKLKTNGKKDANKTKVNSKSPVEHTEDGKALETNRKITKSHGNKKKSKTGKVTSPYFEHSVKSEIKEEVEEEKLHQKKKEKLSSEHKPMKRKLNNKNTAKISKVDKETKLGSKTNTLSRSTKRKRKAVNYKETDADICKGDASSEADPEFFDDDDDDRDDSNADFDDGVNDFDDDDDFIETPRSLSSKLSQKFKKTSSKSCMPSVERGYARNLVKTIGDDIIFEKTSKPVKRKRSLNNIKSSPTVQVISSDSDSSQSKDVVVRANRSASNIDFWCEVYMQSIKRWICIDISSGTVDDVKKIESQASEPLQYIVGIDNQNAIKDVTCRYASKFMSKTRKLRIDREWWAETLHPYETKRKKFDEEENVQLKMSLMQQPFPSTINEFKNHPLYVLEGDLLKFEAIYPEQPAVLGYFRNKAIYSRECVHILHTRENWLKEARVVKQGENAYKIVRGRPKKSTPVHERDKVKIDLFGLWQTEIYKPPPIVDGKVPRNEYGNVELFQPSMIPPGGVHIPIQGIHRTARKLGIDAAPAMMGWDFHGGYAHPIIEGVVVAVEFEEKLLDAWQKDEDERERKFKEKNEKKILERWKMLVKGLLVRERIRRKYDFRDGEHSEHYFAHKEEGASHVSVSWPLNKLEGTTSVNNKGHCHIFLESSYKKDKITGEWTKSCSCGLSMPFEKL